MAVMAVIAMMRLRCVVSGARISPPCLLLRISFC
jgi:hypothetical protein